MKNECHREQDGRTEPVVWLVLCSPLHAVVCSVVATTCCGVFCHGHYSLCCVSGGHYSLWCLLWWPQLAVVCSIVATTHCVVSLVATIRCGMFCGSHYSLCCVLRWSQLTLFCSLVATTRCVLCYDVDTTRCVVLCGGHFSCVVFFVQHSLQVVQYSVMATPCCAVYSGDYHLLCCVLWWPLHAVLYAVVGIFCSSHYILLCSVMASSSLFPAHVQKTYDAKRELAYMLTQVNKWAIVGIERHTQSLVVLDATNKVL